MSTGWAAFLGVISGSIISGTFLILIDWFKHCRKRKELIQEILVRKRIESSSVLINMIIELRDELPLYQTDIEVLRWPKDKRISPEFFKNKEDTNLKEKNDYAEKIYQRIEELRKFMHNNTLIIAKNVQLIFWEHFSEFVSWRNKFRIYADGQLNEQCPDYLENCFNSLNALLDNTKNAIIKDLNVQGFEVFSIEELNNYRRKGVNKVRKYSEEKEKNNKT